MLTSKQWRTIREIMFIRLPQHIVLFRTITIFACRKASRARCFRQLLIQRRKQPILARRGHLLTVSFQTTRTPPFIWLPPRRQRPQTVAIKNQRLRGPRGLKALRDQRDQRVPRRPRRRTP